MSTPSTTETIKARHVDTARYQVPRCSRWRYWVVRLAVGAGWLTSVNPAVLDSYMQWAVTANHFQSAVPAKGNSPGIQHLGFESSIKRAFDIVFAALALFTLAPVLVAIAISIKLESQGPVLYRVRRIGKGGRVFSALKFRTMVASPDQIERGTLARLQASRDFTLRADPRITKVGRFLRIFSLDELPQFWNVLVGEMSVVGPRAPLTLSTPSNLLAQSSQFPIRPGLSGLWQIQSRFDPTLERCLELNSAYYENWSLSLDLRIIVTTIAVVFRGDPVIIKDHIPEIQERPPGFRRDDFRVSRDDDEWVSVVANIASA